MSAPNPEIVSGLSTFDAGTITRRKNSQRLAILDCGCSDPWTAGHLRHQDNGQRSERQIEAYLQAARHLQALGLTPAPLIPELRLAWQRGGKDRRLAQAIAQRWELAA